MSLHKNFTKEHDGTKHFIVVIKLLMTLYAQPHVATDVCCIHFIWRLARYNAYYKMSDCHM